MELNPFSYEFHADPYPVYRWLRDHAPLSYNSTLGFWALTRFKDVVAASHDWATYSSAEGTTVERLDPNVFGLTPMMIFMDPPRHDRLRKLVNHAFTPRRVMALEPLIRSEATRLMEAIARAGGGDFVKDLSAVLPMNVIFTLLGVPAADRATLRHQMDLTLERDDDSPDVPARAIAAHMEMMQYWFAFLQDLKRAPNDGLISALLEAEIDTEAGERTTLTDGEIVGFCALLGSAGNETVTKLLANACVLFARHPEQYARVCADPGLVPSAVEETLRYTSPSQYQGRTTTRAVEWYGETVPAGARILLVTGSANRDEREFGPTADAFDVARDIPIALGFGQGVHFCLGASLARLESRIVVEQFSRRFPAYSVDESRCVRVHMSNVHGYARVPFRLG
jgi:cytochrome P450